MSVKIMALVWEHTDLSQSETLVALALADHADDSGKCYPSIDRIAEKSRLKRRATQTVIRHLEDRGILAVDRSATGRGYTSRYQFQIKGAANAPFPERRVQPDGLKGAATVQKGAVATAPEPSLTVTNHQEDTSRRNGARVPSRHIDLIFSHWQSEHEHPNSKCSEKRRRLISKALKTYTLEELRNCITGYKRSPFHRGDNESGQKYDSLELMLRDEKHVEQGLQFFNDPPKGRSNGAHKPQSARDRSKQRLRERAEQLSRNGG